MNPANRTESRRSLRAPYRTRATLEIPGVTRSGSPWTVETCDANEWGVRISSPGRIPQLPVLIRLRAPGGAELSVKGTVVWSEEKHPGDWEAGIHFDSAHLSLTPLQIDRAAYGT